VSSTTDLLKQFFKTIDALGTSNSIVSTTTTRFVLLVTTVYTTVVSQFYRVLTNIVDTLIVPTKKVIVQVFGGFTAVIARPKKTNVVVTKQDDLNG
jgi:dimeric dUTPase (all-alpha-NTP-PPase superfamily)